MASEVFERPQPIGQLQGRPQADAAFAALPGEAHRNLQPLQNVELPGAQTAEIDAHAIILRVPDLEEVPDIEEGDLSETQEQTVLRLPGDLQMRRLQLPDAGRDRGPPAPAVAPRRREMRRASLLAHRARRRVMPRNRLRKRLFGWIGQGWHENDHPSFFRRISTGFDRF